MKRETKPPKAAQELEAAFKDEGITVRDLVQTLNETRLGAMRFSTKDGSPVGEDHATRAKAAIELLGLLGLPAKDAGREAPVDLAKLLQVDEAADQRLCEDAGL